MDSPQTGKNARVTTGISVVGYSTTEKGLGQAARGYAQALQSLGGPVSRLPLNIDRISVLAPNTLSNPINLLVMNPTPGDVKLAIESIGLTTFKNAYNIGSWWWELPGAPPFHWKKYESLYQELWAGSTFIFNVLSANYSLPVKLMHPVVSIVPDMRLKRERFGIEEDEYLFLFICDFNSIAERKNPIAIVNAFRKAFSPHDKARLFIKVGNTAANPEYWHRLKELSAGANITLLDTLLSKNDLDALTSMCDCYVSLHRSEGFGLTIAEAMLAGKPVVVTGWSGNMDYTTNENSFLVPFELTPVGEGARPYRRGTLWADPHIDTAAKILREIYDHPSSAYKKALLGQETIRSQHSREAVANSAEKALSDAISSTKHRSLSQTSKSLTSSTKNATHITSGQSTMVSVCLPVCNGEDYLHQAIESILNQTFSNFELIILDDCSEDSSVDIIKSYAEKDHRIRFAQNDRRKGLFANYNACMRRATGKYIKPFAQDDVLDRSMLKIGATTLERHPSVSLFSSRRNFIDLNGFVNATPSLEKHVAPTVAEDEVIAGDDCILQCLFPMTNKIGEPSVVMFPKRLMGDGFDEKYLHLGDLDYWFRLLMKGTAYQSSDRLCSYRAHSDNATRTNVQSLMWSVDMLLLGQKLTPFLDQHSRSFEEFVGREILECAGQVKLMTDADLFLGEHALRNSKTPIEWADYRNLAFYALKYCQGGPPKASASANTAKEARLLKQLHTLENQVIRLEDQAQHLEGVKVGYLSDMAERISLLEEEIQSLLASKSWKTTESLRRVSQLFTKPALKISRTLHGRQAIAATQKYQEGTMHEYMCYLVGLKTSILKSRSWLLTSPLRGFGILDD